MADLVPFNNASGGYQPKSFWQRPEGVTGTIFGVGLLTAAGYLLYKALPFILTLLSNTLYAALLLMALAALIYMVLDPRMRNLIWYAYKSVMRWITGLFVQIDPIGILKSYIEDLESSLGKMTKQIGSLRGQMRKLQDLMTQNNTDIQNNLRIASKAQQNNDQNNMVLASRKAARLQESNQKYDVLYKRMEVLYRILTKLYQNSEVVLEDTKDNVRVKEIEYNAIKTSHGAMRSAMSVINGDPDKRAMFEMAMEQTTNDIANKVGEMERFMEQSGKVLDSIDLQNAAYAEDGMNMLEEWEKNSTLALLGDMKAPANISDKLDLNQAPKKIGGEQIELKSDKKAGGNSYDKLFD